MPLRPMPQAPETRALKVAMERTADSRLLLDFLNWAQRFAFIGADGQVYVRISGFDGTNELRIELVDKEDLIARFYGISRQQIADDRRAIEEYTADKLRWFMERAEAEAALSVRGDDMKIKIHWPEGNDDADKTT